MIPATGWLITTPPASRIPNYRFPKEVVLTYSEGAPDFTPRERVPPFRIVAIAQGSFTADLLSGENGSEFGMRAEIRRTGVFGTILIDRLEFDVAAIQLAVEGCPDTTEEVEETASGIVLTGDEACPHVTVPIEETSTQVSINSSDV